MKASYTERVLCIPLIFLFLTACLLKETRSKDQETKNQNSSYKLKYNQTCEWGNKEAVKDFKSGKLTLYRYGLEVEDASPYWRMLKKDYQIDVKSSEGCVIYPSFICYNDYMIEKIGKKYGKNFFSDIEKRFSKK